MSENSKTKINSFTDLVVWQKGHILVLEIYNKTKYFPKREIFGLCSQMERCAVSITSNIAEGFSRRSQKDKIHFFNISQGSLTELQNQLIISKDLGYIKENEYNDLINLLCAVSRLLNALIRSLRYNN